MHNLPRTTALDCAIRHIGSAGALARELAVPASSPSMWKKRGRVPAEHCPAIERATGGAVRCEDLRPDIEWGVLRAPPSAQQEAA
jgi:DNA-binding transcriptional regulator YdaS (Cro superfamily)